MSNKKEIPPLSETHPELSREWSDKNFPFTPDEENYKSLSKVWWIGKCGHEWQGIICNRANRNAGCIYCCGKKVLKGFNDFATQRPNLVSEWSEKNYPKKPDEYTAFSKERIIWVCKKGHEWITSIGTRSGGNGCPICEREPLVPGVNDLATLYPDIAKEWSDKNYPLKPNDIRAYYKKQVIWKCSVCGNEYKCQPFTRVKSTKGCPICRKKNEIKNKREPVARTHEGKEKQSIYRVPVNKIPGTVTSNDVAPYLREGFDLYKGGKYKGHWSTENAKNSVPIWEKYSLSVAEASEYFNIGVIKLRRMIKSIKDPDFITWEHGYMYIIRERFEDYLNTQSEVIKSDDRTS